MSKTTSKAGQLQFKGKMFSLTVLQVQGLGLPEIEQQLQQHIQQAPKMFEHAPVIVDLDLLAAGENPVDLAELNQVLRRYKLIPVGVTTSNTTLQQQALQLDLAIFPAYKATRAAAAPKAEPSPPPVEAAPAPAPAPAPVKTVAVPALPTKIIYQPVRSGQQIYAKNADLIILSHVSHGAEIIADGNIHIYGALHGRAIAGASGNPQARIFCRKLDAELVSIAGVYLLSDAFATRKSEEPMQIYLENDKLFVSAL